MAVFANHHITQAQFDSSLLWYSKDPKRFEKVYTLVIDQLTAEEEAVKSGKYSDLLRKRRTLAHDGLWTGSPRMKINTDSLSHYRQLAFSVKDTKLMMGDRYELRFLARVEACDTCGNLHTRLNLAYAGGRVDSLSLPLPADGKWRRYTLQLDARDKEKVDSLYGHLVAASSFPCGLSVEIDSIRLVREYYKETQEDLRAATCHLESLRTFPYRLFPTPGELTNPLPCSSRFDCVTE